MRKREIALAALAAALLTAGTAKAAAAAVNCYETCMEYFGGVVAFEDEAGEVHFYEYTHCTEEEDASGTITCWYYENQQQ